MKISFALEYNPQYAFVDSRIYSKDYREGLHQSADSWRSLATLRFCFHGKNVEVKSGAFLSVEGDKLDEEFLELAKAIPAREYGFWRQVYDMLEGGKSRRDVLEHMQAYAVARGLKK